MDWTQTLTIILTIGALTAAVWHISKEDMKLVREDMKLIREDMKFIREDMKKREEEISKRDALRDALWAKLLEKIHNVDKKFYALEKQIYKIKSSEGSQKA